MTPLKKRGADGLAGEVHAWAISNCRDSGGFVPTDVADLKDAFNPLSPMAVWHTIPFSVLGLTTMPLSYASPLMANMVIVAIVALMWLMPITVPLVYMLIVCCESKDDKQPQAEEKTKADQPNPAAAEPKKEK